MAAVEELQKIVWPGSDLEVVPSHLLLTAAHNGGLVAGAFVGDRLVGFVFSFLGFDARTVPPILKHCSHELGVHPGYRGGGIGFALKRFQRQFVRDQGLQLVTWTYDPLISRNARLNIARLGAICNTYFPNLYGDLRDGLNAGLPTDRFQVDWWLNAARVEAHMARGADQRPTLADYLSRGGLLLNPSERSGQPVPPEPDVWQSLISGDRPVPPALLLAIPGDFLALKAMTPALALAWRLATRPAFQGLFERGYAVTDFVDEPMPAYVLTPLVLQDANSP